MQRKLLAEIVDKGWSVRAVEQAVRNWHKAMERAAGGDGGPTPPATTASDRDTLVINSLTDRLRDTLGTKVQIRPNAGSEGGRIEVAYFSDEDLERLIELIAS
jgi:ParB family chromosome partitioning protein